MRLVVFLLLALALHAWLLVRLVKPPAVQPRRVALLAPVSMVPAVVATPVSAAVAKPSKNKPRATYGARATPQSDAVATLPVGNSLSVPPSQTGTPVEGAGVPGPPSILSIQSMPDIDTDACGRGIRYPKEAAAHGIQGDVKLRVALDASGKVVEVQVLHGLGHGLDEEAVQALKSKCKFSPAIASDGQAVPFVIDPYIFHFELPSP